VTLRVRVLFGGAGGGGAGAGATPLPPPTTRRRGALFLTALLKVVREAVLDLS